MKSKTKNLNKTEFKIYDDVAGITLAHFQNHKLKSDVKTHLCIRISLHCNDLCKKGYNGEEELMNIPEGKTFLHAESQLNSYSDEHHNKRNIGLK